MFYPPLILWDILITREGVTFLILFHYIVNIVGTSKDNNWLIQEKAIWKLKNLYFLQSLLYILDIKKIHHVSRNYQLFIFLILRQIFMNYMDLNDLNSIIFPMVFLWEYSELEICQWYLYIYLFIYMSFWWPLTQYVKLIVLPLYLVYLI